MSKKRKHQKTDRRSRERRERHIWAQKQKRLEEKRALMRIYLTKTEGERAAEAAFEGKRWNISLKKLRKRQAESKRAAKTRMSNLVKNFEKFDRQWKKLHEIGQRNTGRKRTWRAEKRETQNFYEFIYTHRLTNAHGHKFFNWSEVPFLNPRTKEERARDRALWKRLQLALNKRNHVDAEKAYREVIAEILKNQGLGAKAKGGFERLKKTLQGKKITTRGATINNRNQYYLDYFNYLQAAQDRGLDIFVEAIKKGGAAFTEWLYSTAKFDWQDYYGDKHQSVASNDADKAVYEMARGWQDNSPFGSLLKQMVQEYGDRYGWGRK